MHTTVLTFDAAEFLGGLFAPIQVPPQPAATTPAEPCAVCGCAIGWRLPSGDVLCGACNVHPAEAVQVVAVQIPDGPQWRNYVGEWSEQEAIRSRAENAPTAAHAPTWEECEGLPVPCAQCGGWAAWWTPWGRQCCQKCEPPTIARRTLERAERIRRRLGLPSPPHVTEWLASLQRQTNACFMDN